MTRVLAISRVSRTLMPLLVQNTQIFSEALVVFALEDYANLAVLSSSAHICWVMKYASGMRNDPRYNPADVFGTLPRPQATGRLEDLGESLDQRRQEVMDRCGLGLTPLYNLVNSPQVTRNSDVDAIRLIHAQIDRAVMEAYGWTDIDLDHGFHTYRQIERWTVAPAARIEILDRLLKENHRRAAIEVQAAPKGAKHGMTLAESEQPEGAMF